MRICICVNFYIVFLLNHTRIILPFAYFHQLTVLPDVSSRDQNMVIATFSWPCFQTFRETYSEHYLARFKQNLPCSNRMLTKETSSIMTKSGIWSTRMYNRKSSYRDAFRGPLLPPNGRAGIRALRNRSASDPDRL
jgi:hypothetical protein